MRFCILNLQLYEVLFVNTTQNTWNLFPNSPINSQFLLFIGFFPTKLSKGYFCFDPYLHEYIVKCTYANVYYDGCSHVFLHLQVVWVLWRFSFVTANVNFINGLEKKYLRRAFQLWREQGKMHKRGCLKIWEVCANVMSWSQFDYSLNAFCAKCRNNLVPCRCYYLQW